MYHKKEWIAMLLAGGQGSRLGVLTKNIAKPAVAFGSKYRIIDFTLSNCVNSGIDTVGVLTQYQPLELNEYIGNGSAWDLDRMYGGVHILPPYQQSEGGDFYKGTANAVYQNLPFIERYDPEYVIVLSGDHIYEMNYDRMLIEHRKNKADCTIAVLRVDKSEASRFGIMDTDRYGRILSFEEKPRCPKSDLASMGVYIFSCEKLKRYLRADERDPNSKNDFGRNIIPKMLAAGEKLYAYRFNGYWKDVGTLKSLWEANMDLLSEKNTHAADGDFKIFSQNPPLPPQYLAPQATVLQSLLTDGCEVYGRVEHSVLFAGVLVEKDALVVGSILMPGCRIGSGSRVYYSIIGPGCTVGRSTLIGAPCVGQRPTEEELTVLAGRLTIGDGVCVAPGQMLSRSRRGGGSHA